MAVTQKFIAREAGVSQKTVSLYFQNSPLVAHHTREKLRNLTERYGYFPNLAARSIKTKRFKRIACVVIQGSEHSQVFNHPHLMAYINGAAIELAKYGYSLVLEPFLVNNSKDEFFNSPEFFASLSVDGILGLPGGWVSPKVDETIRSMGVPAVWLNRYQPDLEIDCLNFDEAKGTRLLTEHLLRQNYHRIAWFGPEFIKDVAHHYSARKRYETVKAVLEENGAELYRSEFCRVGEKLSPGAARLISGPDRPDAIICSHYSYLDAVNYAALSTGINVPHQLQTVHFASAWECTPDNCDAKTFLLLPENQLGQNAAKFIYNRLNGKHCPELLLPLSGTLHIGTSIVDNIKTDNQRG